MWAQTRRATAVLLLAAAVATLGAGCGGSGGATTAGPAPGSEDAFTAYETTMQKQGVDLYRTQARLFKANVRAPRATVEVNLHRTSAELRAAAVKLTKVKAPDEIKAQHAALVTAVRRYADDLDGVAAKLKQGASLALLGTIDTLPGVKQMAKATGEIAQAGYVIVAA